MTKRTEKILKVAIFGHTDAPLGWVPVCGVAPGKSAGVFAEVLSIVVAVASSG